jgi:hypothetical protein
MADDVVDRLRKQTGLGITRVVVRREDAAEPLARPGVVQVAVIADQALGGSGLTEALRDRADRGPIAAVILAPMDLQVPGWTDEAERLRSEAAARVRLAIDALQAVGVQARGEVLDGDAAEAARVARDAHGAQAVLIVAVRGSRLDSDETVQRATAAAAPVPVERIVVETPTAPAGG